jgi:hypothetical protein
MFGQFKNNFAVDDRVIIGQTTSELLDGKSGTILGKAVEDRSDVYIVMLDEPTPYARAVCLTEVCLTREIKAIVA